MAMTETQKTDAYQFFVVAFGAVTGVEYMNQLDAAYSAGMSTQDIVNVYTTKPQFTSQYPTFLTNQQFAQKLVANVVGNSATAEAKAAAESEIQAALNAGWSRGDVIYQIFSNLADKPHDDAVWGNTAKMFANKVAVSQYLTEVKLVSETDQAKLQGYLSNVTADSDVSTPEAIEGVINGGGASTVALTLGNDNIVATQEGMTFTAGLAQGGFLGNVSNTLESGDKIIAKGEGNTLKADLTLTTTGAVPVGPAISATTENIQKVVLRAQTGPTDQVGAPHGNESSIDAENMKGVKEWWTDNSRATIQIEDVRTRPEDTLIGMRDTDPEVGFRVYFDPEQLKANGTVKNSALTLTLDKISAPGDLSNNVFNGVKFTLGGKSITLQSDAIGAATTHAELLAALEAAAADNADLAGVTAKLNADNTITLTDAAGKAFGTGSWLTPTGDIPAAGDFKWNQKVGEPERGQELITTQVELDNVGRTSAGGALDIGSLGNGGVEKFNVAVDRDSWLTAMRSQDHLGENGGVNAGTQRQFLQEVHLTSKGAEGDLKVGNIVANRLDGRLTQGLTDVRVVDGSEFKGDLNLGINLTANGANGSVARYLDKSTKPVEFNYTGGQGEDLFNINVESAAVSNHKNFVMNINTGAGDDRVVLSNLGRLNTTSVDGGEGTNTLVMNGNVGMGAAANSAASTANTFKSFKNFQNYEIEGGNHDFTTLNGVESVIVATSVVNNIAPSTVLRNLPTDLNSVVVTGKNQTAAAGQANAAQVFDHLDFQAAKNAALTVKLENTALVDGRLQVQNLHVQDDQSDATNKSAVRTLNVESTGVEDAASPNVIGNATFNAVTGNVNGLTNVGGINGGLVNTINLSGDHALWARIDSASNSTAGVAANRDNLKVDGSGMEADAALHLRVNSAIVNRVDVASKNVNLLGGASDKDQLVFDGAVTSTARTTVTGFETVSYTNAAKVDAANFSGVQLYKSAGAGVVDIDNLKGVEHVELAVASAFAQKFHTADTSATSALNLAIENGAAATQRIDTKGFTTLNIDLSKDAANKSFTLDTSYVVRNAAGDYGNTLAVNNSATQLNHFTKANLKNIVVTGGAGVDGSDQLALGSLSAVVTTLDVSGYKGTVSATIAAPLKDTTPGSTGVTTGNTIVKVGAYGVDLKDFNHVTTAVESITTFVFTTDAAKDATANAAYQWKITSGFTGKQDGGASQPLGDISKIDVSALGIHDGGLNINTVGPNTEITANGYNFKIVLTGVLGNELTGDNFVYAA